MSELFKPSYRLTVDQYLITGLDIAYEVEKTRKRTPNTAAITVYNLSEPQRQGLSALSVAKKRGTGKIRCTLEVGYEDSTFIAFRGDLRTAEHTREGGTWRTVIEGEDGGRAALKGRVSQSFPPGTPVSVVVLACASALGVGPGNLPALAAALATRGGSTFSEGTVLDGSAADELHSLLHSCGYTYSIQNGVLQVLRAGRPLSTVGVLLSSGTGLLDVPSISPDGTIKARAMMVPGLDPGARCVLRSSTVNGQYQVSKAKLVGDSAGTDWHIDLELQV